MLIYNRGVNPIKKKKKKKYACTIVWMEHKIEYSNEKFYF